MISDTENAQSPLFDTERSISINTAAWIRRRWPNSLLRLVFRWSAGIVICLLSTLGLGVVYLWFDPEAAATMYAQMLWHSSNLLIDIQTLMTALKR